MTIWKKKMMNDEKEKVTWGNLEIVTNIHLLLLYLPLFCHVCVCFFVIFLVHTVFCNRFAQLYV